MKQIKVGVGLGLWRLGLPEPETIARVAARAEEWGIDSFWLSDHLLAPTPELDVVATLSLIASRTSKMRLGPSVYLLNLRHPLIVAKAFASLDYLARGRIVMAVGTGANLEDYAACGIPLEARGARLDEGIAILRKVWLEPRVSFAGKFYNFENVTIDPRPAPRLNNDFGTIDLWIGGQSKGALMRTARLGDGYFASFQTPDEFAAHMAAIREYAKGYGREHARIESGLILRCRISTSKERALEEIDPKLWRIGAVDGEAVLKRSVYGSPDDIIARMQDYVAAGLDKFVLWPIATPEDWPQQMELIGREIASHYMKVAA
ncbi:MAG TPA: LLM class flavin-dependent oxidoreductase [Candidatus Binataceae bacterium]|nr:LLM class flavin-dependent oxidoreductase [Candidatus Binataceae bacterium]